MTKTQKNRMTRLIVAELVRLRRAALAAGVSPADVDRELDRRHAAVRESAR